ncbi:MAG TPA: DUF4388 domain-containing protein [Pyrinomonadaceae bacterium]|nr:DUF4388 domain-containing protein [Pyrinomonadaceae bacterium]
MQNNRFVVLTGHLSNYSLSDLVGILRHQKKSGRLLIEYPKGPATLFFENGELVDVHLNELSGLQAICVLLSQPDASFNFNPLIRSSQRSIDHSMQRVVSELFGCWDETAVQIEAASSIRPLELQSDIPHEAAALPAPVERLALPPAPHAVTRQESIYVIAAAVIIVIAISTVIALTANLNRREGDATSVVDRNVVAAAVENGSANKPKPNEVSNRVTESGRSRSVFAEQRRDNKAAAKRAADVPDQAESSASSANDSVETKARSISVVMQIENGRVLNASIANHAAGMDNFEALALRIARQRRYPTGRNGNETVTISVNKAEK